MAIAHPFDLPAFMLSHFGRVDFGGDLFGQWPVGIRFEIGLKEVSRAAKLFEFIFGKAEDCILVSEDWPGEDIAWRSRPLFETPNVFPVTSPSHLQRLEISPFDETQYRLTWTQLSPRDFDAAQMFRAIANREQGGVPAIRSSVFVIEPQAEIIMHMYDDRGLDVIATDIDALRPLYKNFEEWVLDNQRDRVAFRFKDPKD